LRIRRGMQLLLPIYVACLFLASGALAAQTVKNSDATEITLDFQDVELVDLISTISELTGKNFIYDEGVKGKVSILSPRPVSIAEAYELFTTVLNVKGFTVVPSGQVNKIVLTRNAKEENLPISSGWSLTCRPIRLLSPTVPRTSIAWSSCSIPWTIPWRVSRWRSCSCNMPVPKILPTW